MIDVHSSYQPLTGILSSSTVLILLEDNSQVSSVLLTRLVKRWRMGGSAIQCCYAAIERGELSALINFAESKNTNVTFRSPQKCIVEGAPCRLQSPRARGAYGVAASERKWVSSTSKVKSLVAGFLLLTLH